MLTRFLGRLGFVRSLPEKQAPSAPLFSDYCEQWLAQIRWNVKPGTLAGYRSLLKLHIIPTLGQIPVDQLNADVIKSLLHTLESSNTSGTRRLSASVLQNICTVLRSILNMAEQDGYYTGPAIQLTAPRKLSKNLTVLTEEEFTRLEEYLLRHPCTANLGILICMYTGLRIGELCALKWSGIDLQRQTLTVFETVQRVSVEGGEKKTALIFISPKSAGSYRCIPLPVFLCKLLESCPGDPDCFVLTGSSRCMEPRSMQKYFHAVLDSANIAQVNFHVLRHTFATRCVVLGFDTKALSMILGHASVSTTLNTYVHPSFETMQSNMQKLTSKAV